MLISGGFSTGLTDALVQAVISVALNQFYSSLIQLFKFDAAPHRRVFFSKHNCSLTSASPWARFWSPLYWGFFAEETGAVSFCGAENLAYLSVKWQMQFHWTAVGLHKKIRAVRFLEG